MNLDTKNNPADSAASNRHTLSSLSNPNPNPLPSRSPRSRLKLEAPWIILIALLLSTLVASYQSYQRAKVEAQSRYTESARAAQLNFVAALQSSVDLVEGATALVTAVPKIESSQLNVFFNAHSDANHEYQGLVRTIYSSVDPTNPLLFSRGYDAAPDGDLRGSADLNVNVKVSASDNDDGDILQHPAVIKAIALADASQKMVFTDALQVAKTNLAPPNLAQPHRQPGTSPAMVAFVIPVFAAQPLPPTNMGSSVAIPTKQGALLGHFISIVRLNDVVAYIDANFGHRLSLALMSNNQMIYSDTKPTSQGAPAYSQLFDINSGQRLWNLRVDSTPLLEKELSSDTPRVILLVGMLGTLLLTGLIWLLTRLREQAETLAARITDKLQDQVKFTEDLIEFNPNPIFRKDAEGRFTAVNRAWEQLSGRNRRDVLGKTNQDFTNANVALPTDLVEHDLITTDFSTAGADYEVNEVFISNADGQRFETIISKQVLRRADGAIDGLIGTITDISQKKKLEQDLAQQREQLDLVIRSSQQGIWDIELKPGGRTYFSERFFEMLGYRSQLQLTNTDWRAQLHPEDVPRFAQEMVRHFKKETPFFDNEVRVRKQNGEYIWIRARAVAQFNPEGRATRFVGSISDISDSKAVESTMREANVRIVEAARAKEAFLATMSHEIRTPLNGVLGMAGLLSDTPLNDEQRDYIRLIRASGDTLLRLIDDVLDFSKIESGRMTLEAIPIEITTLVEEAFDLVAEKAREKQIALIYDIREDVPFYILGDATRIRQILLNMLSNALKFTAHGEIKLTITAKRTSDGKLELEGRVKDTGIGIPADQLAKLFQPFTQADASTTRKYGGTGLGLAIIRRLTQLMNGDVRAESEVGCGSTFIFTIATQAARGPLSPYMQRNVIDFVGKQLLVVESRVSRHAGMRHFLNYWGFQATIVLPEDAATALHAAPQTDIIMTDLVLPSEEGYSLQKVMNTIDATRVARYAQPIVSILLSTFSRQELQQRNIIPPVQYDIFLLRPCGKPRMFDALMRGVLHELNADAGNHSAQTYKQIHTQPETSASALTSAAATTTAGPLSTNSVSTDQRKSGRDRAAFDTTALLVPLQMSQPTLNILVAEDNEINQRVIVGMLKNLNQNVSLVENGRLAVAAVVASVAAALDHGVNTPFDLILMDIHMPELDGVSAMREIRSYFHAHLQGQNCPPIVAMTAHAMAGDREHYLESGMDDYLSKPIKMANLLKLLTRLNNDFNNSHIDPKLPSVAIGTPLEKKTIMKTDAINLAPPMAITISNPDTLPILDKEQLEDLRYLPAVPNASQSNGKTDSVGSLISLFQTKARERMTLMGSYIVQEDWKQLSEVAHSLRGASASMGFPRVALLCKDLELASRQFATAASAANTSAGTINQDDTNLTADATVVQKISEIFELIQMHYSEAETALSHWLREA